MGQLAPVPVLQFFDPNGLPLAGGKLFSYVAGSSTLHATYTDATAGTPNTNPIILDANGKCVAWLDDTAYKLVLKDSTNVVQWTSDNIQSLPDGSITTIKLADGSVTTVKLADDAVTTVKILDQNVTSAKIKDANVTTAKIADSAVTPAKLSASTAIAFVDTSRPRHGDGPTAYPVKPWTAPVTIANPATPPVGDGLGVAWSPNGKLLAVAENNTDYVALYERLGDELVKLSPGLTGAPAEVGVAVSWSPSGKYFAVLGGTSVKFFQRCGDTYASIFPPFVGVRAAGAWCPNELYYAATSNVSPFVAIAKRGDILGNNILLKYTSTSGQAIAASTPTTVIYATKIVDNANSYTPLAGFFFFTALRQNGYTLRAQVSFAGTVNWAGGDKFTLSVYVNGVYSETIDFHRVAATWAGSGSGDKLVLKGQTWIYLQANDQLSFTLNHTNASSRSLDTDPGFNMVSIVEDESFEELSSFTLLAATPATPAAAASKSIAWSPDGMFLAVGQDKTRYIFTVTAANANTGATYTNNGVTFTVLSTIAGATILSASGNSAPAASGTLTKTGGVGDATITFSAVSDPVCVTIYQRAGDTFAKCADPAAMPTGQVNGLAWSPDGLTLTCVHATAPFITSYYRSSITSTTFTKIAVNPSVLPAGAGNACAYNSLGTKLAVAHDSSPFVTIYSVSGTGSSKTYTKDADPGALPTGNGRSVSWTPDSQYLSVGHVSSPYVTNYKTSGTFGSNAVIFVNEVDLV